MDLIERLNCKLDIYKKSWKNRNNAGRRCVINYYPAPLGAFVSPDI